MGKDKLDEAVAKMTEKAQEAGMLGLIKSPEEWERLVVSYHNNPKATAFYEEIHKHLSRVTSLEELNDWVQLATNIWNNTPQPDRGGLTPNQMVEEALKAQTRMARRYRRRK